MLIAAMRLFGGALFAAPIVAISPAAAQLGDLLFAPRTLIDRTIEARSAVYIARDNAIVLDGVRKVVDYVGARP